MSCVKKFTARGIRRREGGEEHMTEVYIVCTISKVIMTPHLKYLQKA
jgi:hypothetical protein